MTSSKPGPGATAPETAPVVSARGVTKTYKVYPRPWDRLWELVSSGRRHTPVHAVDDVSFELRPGESLGIIGENGAGKSTLLSILAGVVSPSGGRLEVRGQTASLLELGMGFHPELTGRQNIRLNAAFQGISERRVERLIPEILDFSELGDFADRPVKTYSTGMTMRLGFAVAIQVEPDVLIIDEALSVGDGYFQKKCMSCIQSFVESGRTLIFCSHALYYVSAYCRRALWLRQGRIAAQGPVEQVVRDYENFLLSKDEGAPAAAAGEAETPSAGPARIASVRQLGDRPAPTYRHREPWGLEVEWETADPSLPFHLGVGIDRIDGVQICSFGTHRDGLSPWIGSRCYSARLRVPELPMLKGEFTLYVFLLDEAGLHVYDRRVIPSAFSIETPERYHIGLIETGHSWEVARSAEAAPRAPAAGARTL